MKKVANWLVILTSWKGGNIARIAKEQLERETGKKVVSDKNAKEIRKLNSGEEQ